MWGTIPTVLHPKKKKYRLVIMVVTNFHVIEVIKVDKTYIVIVIVIHFMDGEI